MKRHFILFIVFIFSCAYHSIAQNNSRNISDKYISTISDNAQFIADDGDILTALTILTELNTNPQYFGNKQIEAAMRYILNKYKKYEFLPITKIYDTSNRTIFSSIDNDGNLIYSATNSEILIYDIKQGCYLSPINIRDNIFVEYELSFDGNYILASQDNDCLLINLNDKSILTKFEAKKIDDLIKDRYTHLISYATISNDNKIVATLSDRYLCLWDSSTGKIIHFIDTQISNSNISAKFSNNNSKLVIFGNKTALLIDTNTGEIIQTINTEYKINTALLSLDGTILIISSNNKIMTYKCNTGQVINCFDFGFTAIDAYCIDEHLTALIGNDNNIYTISNILNYPYVSTITSKTPITNNSISIESFSKNGKYIVSDIYTQDNDKYMQVWEYQDSIPPTFQYIDTNSKHFIDKMEYNNDGSMILAFFKPKLNFNNAYPSDQFHQIINQYNHECKDIHIYDTKTFAQISSLTGHSNKITSATFFNDNNQIASGSLDSTIRIWDTKTQKCTQTIKPHIGEIIDLAVNPKNNQITAITAEKKLSIIGVNGTLYGVIPTDSATQIAYSPNGKRIYTSENNKIAIRNAQNGKFIKYALNASTFWDINLSKNGLYAVTTNRHNTLLPHTPYQYTIEIWDLDSEKLVNTICLNSSNYCPYIEICEKEKTLIVSHHKDGGIRGKNILVYDIASGQILNKTCIKDFSVNATMSPDGETIVIGASNFCIWDYSSPQTILNKCQEIIGNHKLSAKERKKYNLD